MKTSLTTTTANFHTADIRWTDRYLSQTPFHSGYWVRTRIDAAISSHAKLAHGVLLDVGCGIKPFEATLAPFVERYIGLEYSPESGYLGNKADFCGDAALLPLADESVDTVLCTEVMEHVPDPEKTIAEFARVLRPGGTLITTAPFVYPIHDKYDFFRYSPDGLAAIMKRNGMTIDKVEPLSGTAVTLAAMFNLYWYDVGFMWTKWLYPIGLILRPALWLVCFVVNVLGGLFEKVVPSTHMSFNHLTIARKPEQ
ncbi:MAG: class I SAM-dependent methyltransferase [Pyrinomonadaceae bacterium]|nr:class I SAM-dependent methyltransferase [Pyrinomonadaceae bacterium]MBP6213376.1 class I SAM-dependent methyltransferase [Pyrinomonadaceae bacterium]